MKKGEPWQRDSTIGSELKLNGKRSSLCHKKRGRLLARPKPSTHRTVDAERLVIMEIEIRGLSALSLLLGTLPARACPICATETGAQVRDQIFNDGFVA